MVKSITFNKVDLSKTRNYITELPCLIGKTFEFKPGLNIICGYNGCGKSSLLRCIRRMTFCDKQVHSKLITDDFTWCKVHSVMEDLYSTIDLINDWNKSVFSLRPSEEVNGENFCDDMTNFSQMMSSGSWSSGMNTTSAIVYLLELLSKSRKGAEDSKIRDFNKQVMEVRLSCRIDSTLAGATSEKDSAFGVKKYMTSHHVDTEGVTVIMDEPDKSLDILMMDKIFNILKPDDRSFKNSFLLVFHNSDMISRFMTSEYKDKVNWIELTPGYLDNVERFHKCEKLRIPENQWWLHPKFNKETKGEK